MKRVLLWFMAALFVASSALAVPNLQLYIPGGTFDSGTETWVAPSSGNFEVWVLAANLSATDIIYDIGLTAALRTTADPFGGTLSITPSGGSSTMYGGSDFLWGTPPVDDPLPSHGIFPSWYIDHMVAAQTSTNSLDWEDVYDMPTMGGPSTGQIFRFEVASTFDYVHFDAYGYLTKKNGDTRRIFAPFSHDAESGPPPVPEPATMVLFGIGLAGAGVVRKFRANKKA